MPAFTTEGIILKRSNFGEADRIITVLTPFKGKIKVLAKGVRRITSRRGGNVELLNKVKLYLYQGQGFNILNEAISSETFPKLKEDIVLSSYASHLIELVDRFVPEEQVNTSVYYLLLEALHKLEQNPRKVFIRAFEVKLLSDLGFWSLNKIEADERIKSILKKLETDNWDSISKMEFDSNMGVEVERILRYYMEEVLEAKLKSLEVIEKLKVKG